MYYESFSQYVRCKVNERRYNIEDVKDEGEFCRIIPKESMSVGELRGLYTYLNSIEDINAFMDNPDYMIAEHDI